MAILTIGDEFPEYDFQAVVGGVLSDLPVNKEEDYFTRVRSADVPEGQWRLFIMWPKDFTFVCPTELAGIAGVYEDLQERHCDVVAVNTDSEYVHLAWRSKDELLKNVPFPLASDLTQEFVKAVGVLNRDGVCDRASYLVDPDNRVRFVSVDDGSVGRNAEELVRQLDALQSGGLTSCGWHPGEPTLDVFKAATNLVSLSI